MILLRVGFVNGLRIYVFLAWVLFVCGTWLERVPTFDATTGRIIRRAAPRRCYRVGVLGLVVQVSVPAK